MTITLSLLALTLLSSFGLLVAKILSAPEGYEDETGFYLSGNTDQNLRAVSANAKSVPVATFASVTAGPFSL